jgi:hypothetical protein
VIKKEFFVGLFPTVLVLLTTLNTVRVSAGGGVAVPVPVFTFAKLKIPMNAMIKKNTFFILSGFFLNLVE